MDSHDKNVLLKATKIYLESSKRKDTVSSADLRKIKEITEFCSRLDKESAQKIISNADKKDISLTFEIIKEAESCGK